MELYCHGTFERHRVRERFAALSKARTVRPILGCLFNPGSVKKNGWTHNQRGRKEKNS